MSGATAAIAAAVVAGVAAAVQATVAALLGRRAGVFVATALVALVGTVLITALALTIGTGTSGLRVAVRGPAWMWLLPGALGAVVLTTLTFAPPRIGVVATFALIIAGQLVGSAVIDAVGLFGVERVPLTAMRVAGLALLAAGAALVLLRR